MTRFTTGSIFLLLTLLSAPHPSLAYWTPGGNQISSELNDENLEDAVADGADGAILAWIDERDDGSRLGRVQRVDRRGDVRWTPEGIGLGATRLSKIALAPDGSGGCFVAWAGRSEFSTDDDVLVQRFNASGAALWTAGGVPVADTSADENGCVIAVDGLGGLFVAWIDDRTGNRELYYKHYDVDGNTLFAPDGVMVSGTTGTKFDPEIVAAASGSAIVVWRDQRFGNTDIFAQKVDSQGQRLWGSDTPVCTDPAEQSELHVTPSEAGGVIAAWLDLRNAQFDVYCQSVGSDGTALWTTDGVLVTDLSAAVLWDGGVITDGANGAIVTWADNRNGDLDVFIQRVNAAGRFAWGRNGTPVCVLPSRSDDAVLVSDSEGGAAIVWSDERNGSFPREQFLQRINASGFPQFALNGIVVLGQDMQQAQGMRVVTDANRSLLLLWNDGRSPDGRDVYAYGFGLDGLPDTPEPQILSVLDVPDDEGGWVRLQTRSSAYDHETAFYDIVTGYNVWRLVPPGAVAKTDSEGAFRVEASVDAVRLSTILADPVASDGFRPTSAQAAAIGLPSGEWESLGLHGAFLLDEYSFTVPTRADWTVSLPAEDTYLITAHTTTHTVIFVSGSASGSSIDNLAPGMPAAITGSASYDPLGLQLSWDAVPAGDLSNYVVHRGSGPGFVPDENTLLGEPTGLSWFDPSWDGTPDTWYKIAAVDRHENVGPYASFASNEATDARPVAVSRSRLLAQNYPNPFNPSTTIAFEMPQSGRAVVQVYDASGALVATLVDEPRPAGHNTVTWDGRNQAGMAASSGVYRVRLLTPAGTDAIQVVLLK